MMQLGVDFVYIDEYNVGSHILQPYTWMKKGTENHVFVQARDKTQHLIVAATLFKLLCFELLDGPINSNSFCKFMETVHSVISENISMNPAIPILLFDNFSVHISNQTQKKLDQLGLLAFTNIAHSPQLNYAEQFIKCHKMRLGLQIKMLKPLLRGVIIQTCLGIGDQSFE